MTDHHTSRSSASRVRSFAVATSLVVATVTSLVLGVSNDASAAAKAGQLCSAAKEGTKDGALTCTKDGTRFRWTGGAATPATTAAPKTTKAAKTTATTKAPKSSPAPASPAPASAPGQPVNGRFCAKADGGKKGTDNKGQSLTCKADASGKFRWTK